MYSIKLTFNVSQFLDLWRAFPRFINLYLCLTLYIVHTTPTHTWHRMSDHDTMFKHKTPITINIHEWMITYINSADDSNELRHGILFIESLRLPDPIGPIVCHFNLVFLMSSIPVILLSLGLFHSGSNTNSLCYWMISHEGRTDRWKHMCKLW